MSARVDPKILAKALIDRKRALLPSRDLPRLESALRDATPRPILGRVKRVLGAIVEAKLAGARIGDICELRSPGPGARAPLLAEVVGLKEDGAALSAMGDLTGLSENAQVIPTHRPLTTPVGDALLGRVLDGLGRPLDEATRGPLRTTDRRPVRAEPPDLLSRGRVERIMPMGIPAIDAFTTIGEGQRIGLFGEPGVGKSTLMAAIAKAASADVAVIALVGERGREVNEFIEDALGQAGLRRSVVVAATSDRPAMERLQAPFTATAIAEAFRDRGKKVVLLMDSLTRLARAQREIGLAAGEPPSRRAFPPSVFALMPRLIERAGAAPDGGAITAFYTVLVEGDGEDDPVAEEARALLDGHIALSREIAERGEFPAIDVLASLSRVMNRIVSSGHRQRADRVRTLMARRREVDLLVRLGEHRPGRDPVADEALAKEDAIRAFIRRDLASPMAWSRMGAALKELAGG